MTASGAGWNLVDRYLIRPAPGWNFRINVVLSLIRMTRPPWRQYPIESKSHTGQLVCGTLSTYVESQEERMSYWVWIARSMSHVRMALRCIYICTQMPNEACRNERNVDADIKPRDSGQHFFVRQMFGEQSNAIHLESVLQRKIH